MLSSPTPETGLELAQLERQLRYMPAKDSELMPTKFGNALKAAEARATTHYGLNPQVLWPHLKQLMPESALREFEESQKLLRGSVERIIWGSLFVGFAYLAWWPPVVGTVVAIFSYLTLPGRAYAVADLAAVSWDLYRVELYRKFRWPLPQSPEDELAQGPRLTTYVWRGSGSSSPTFTEPE
jgi:hypothetical protein